MKKPKDLHLGEIAYNTFYGERPQVFFDDLSVEAQMKWVRLCRAIVEEYKKTTPGAVLVRASPKSAANPANENGYPTRGRAAKRGPPPGRNDPKKRKFIIKTMEQKVKDWAEADAKDLSLLTNKPWRERSQKETDARNRIKYRETEREKNGLERLHDNITR